MRVMTENPMGRQRSGWRYKLYRAGRGIQRNWGLYLLLLPAVVLLFCFNYLPMYGVQIAFRDFSPSQGIQGSRGWLFSDALLCSGCAGYSGGRRCVPRRIYRRIAARAFSQRSRSACHGSFLHQVYQNRWQSRHSRLEYGAALFAHRGNRLYGN